MKISELTGRALDAAVHVALGHERPLYAEPDIPHYSTDWAAGGPVIEQARIGLRDYVGEWQAFTDISPSSDFGCVGMGADDAQVGPTPLIAAMRTLVAMKLSDIDVQITDRQHPAEVRILPPE